MADIFISSTSFFMTGTATDRRDRARRLTIKSFEFEFETSTVYVNMDNLQTGRMGNNMGNLWATTNFTTY
jgi:hypothetical protein